jgi:hypothetical protein
MKCEGAGLLIPQSKAERSVRVRSSLLLHLSPALAWMFIPFGHVLGPLTLWLVAPKTSFVQKGVWRCCAVSNLDLHSDGFDLRYSQLVPWLNGPRDYCSRSVIGALKGALAAIIGFLI